MNPTPQQAVDGANQAKQQYESIMKDFGSDPAKTIGMTPEELERRREQASKAREVKIGDKKFNVSSTTYSQQVMQKGTNEMLRSKRLKDFEEKMGIVKNLRWVVIGTFAGIGCLMSYYMILPRLVVHTEYLRRAQLRSDRAYEDWQAREEEMKAAAANNNKK